MTLARLTAYSATFGSILAVHIAIIYALQRPPMALPKPIQPALIIEWVAPATAAATPAIKPALPKPKQLPQPVAVPADQTSPQLSPAQSTLPSWADNASKEVKVKPIESNTASLSGSSPQAAASTNANSHALTQPITETQGANPTEAEVLASVKDARAEWAQRIQQHLSRYQRYSEEARRLGLEGTVKLRFRINAAGQVLDARLSTATGSHLDEDALNLLKTAQPLPPPPAEVLSRGANELILPLRYSLRMR